MLNLPGRPLPVISQYKGIKYLANPWHYQGDGYTMVLPAGFVTDLGSVPRLFWPLVSPDDLTFAGTIMHDYLYQFGGKPIVYPARTFTRKEADKLFLDLMKEEKVAWWRRSLAYLAVRWFGWAAWQKK